MIIYRSLFKKIGDNLIFDPYGTYSFHNISFGNDVYIGPGAVLYAEDAEIIFGSKILIGPNVTIITGDHNSSVLGKYMFDVKNKLPENDQPIIIEDDVWIGSGVTLLKGITIGTGSIIASGAVLTKSVEPNSIVAGVPGKVIRKRFDSESLKLHLEKLRIPS